VLVSKWLTKSKPHESGFGSILICGEADGVMNFMPNVGRCAPLGRACVGQAPGASRGMEVRSSPVSSAPRICFRAQPQSFPRLAVQIAAIPTRRRLDAMRLPSGPLHVESNHDPLPQWERADAGTKSHRTGQMAVNEIR
jgi:hypothetical protein